MTVRVLRPVLIITFAAAAVAGLREWAFARNDRAAAETKPPA